MSLMLKENRKTDILYLINYLHKLIDQDLDKRLSEHGLTSQQGRILFFVNGKTRCEGMEVHQNDIENDYHLSKSTVSRLVKRMEKKGLITIEKQHPYAIIKPAEKGLDIIRHLSKHRDEAINNLTKGFDEKNKDQIIQSLIKLIENMEGGR